MHTEGASLDEKECHAQFSKMNDGELVAQMSVLLGGIAALKRLQEVGITPANVDQLLFGFECGRLIINGVAKSRGIIFRAERP
jgi:hypothetical protein